MQTRSLPAHHQGLSMNPQLHSLRERLHRSPHRQLRLRATLGILALGLIAGIWGAVGWQQQGSQVDPAATGFTALSGPAWDTGMGLAQFLLLVLILIGVLALTRTRHHLAAGRTREQEFQATLVTGTVVTAAALAAVVLSYLISVSFEDGALPVGAAPGASMLVFLGLHYLASFLVGAIIAATFIGYGTDQTLLVIIGLVAMRGLPLAIGVDTSYVRIDLAEHGATDPKAFLFWLLAVPILATVARFVLLRLKIRR